MSPALAVAIQPRPASNETSDLERLADDALLARFFQARDEAAFAHLLARHGPLVLGVCQRILGNSSDAEDAFQATFLVLVKKGRTLSEPERLANWLYGVAQRTARKIKFQAASRSKWERQAIPMQSTDQGAMTYQELRAILDQEISQLPEKYALPLVLCYLEGKTNAQAAAHLGWPEGSMSRRLSRARELLRSRLAKRGLALSVALVAAVFSNSAEAGIPPHLAAATLDASCRVMQGEAVEQVVSPVTASVVSDVLEATQESSKLTLALAIAVIVLAVVSIGWQLDAHAFAASLLLPDKGPHGSMTLTGGASSSVSTTSSACGAPAVPAPCGTAPLVSAKTP